LFVIQADEPYLAWLGKRAMDGMVPYRDFFTIHPPGVISLVALWFKAFGSSLASLRVLQILVEAAAAGLLCRCLLNMGLRPTIAAATSLVIPFAFFVSWPVASYHHLAVALGVAASWQQAQRVLPYPGAAAYFLPECSQGWRASWPKM